MHDPKREFYREFYRPGIDWAIDPRLEECPYWAMEDEAADEPEATPWARAFFRSIRALNRSLCASRGLFLLIAIAV